MRRARWASIIAATLAILPIAASCSSPQSTRYWNGKPPTSDIHLAALPIAATVPPGSGPTAAATYLAARLVAATTANQQRSLVVAALVMSGISVDGGPTATGPAMAVPIEPWEVDMLAQLEASHVRFPLDDIAMALGRAIPHVDTSPVAGMIVTAVQEGATATANTSAQFWAQLLTALGERAPEPYSLLTADRSTISLDGVQMELLLRSMLTGMAAEAYSHGATGTPKSTPPSANARPNVLGPTTVEAAGADCTLVENVINATDIGAYISHDVWNTLADYLAEKGGGLLYSKVLSATGIIFSYLKLLMTFAELKLDLSIDGNGPLVRTLNATPGEQRQISAHAYYDTGDAQIINCIRYALLAIGMDLSVPQRGPITTGAVYFHLIKGGEQPGGSVELKIAPGQTTTVFTDENGKAAITIEGQAKNPPLPQNVAPVNVEAQLEATVKAKGGSLGEDAQDILGSAFVVATDPVAILTIPADILLRTRVFAPTILTIPVVDHGADYKVDFSGPNAVRFTGVKCGGPAGEWDLDVTGQLANSTVTVIYSGLIVVQLSGNTTLPAPLGGVVGGVIHEHITGSGQSIFAEYTVHGSAHLDPGALVASMTGVGVVPGYGTGTGSDTLTIPVEIGSYCVDGKPSQ